METHPRTRQSLRRPLRPIPGFQDAFLEGKTPFLLNDEKTVALSFDFDKLNRVMVRIAKGLHFDRTGERLTDELMAISPFILNDSYAFEIWGEIGSVVAKLPWKDGPNCENPEVFRYRYLADDPQIDIQFYNGFRVLLNPRPVT